MFFPQGIVAYACMFVFKTVFWRATRSLTQVLNMLFFNMFPVPSKRLINWLIKKAVDQK